MNQIQNKDTLLEAIDAYSLLSANQKKVLKILTFYENRIPAKVVIEKANLSKQVIYPILNKLVRANLILRHKDDECLLTSFEPNKQKLYEILDFYYKSKDLSKKI